MAPRSVTWTATALEDLKAIVEAIGRDSPAYAAAFARESPRSLGAAAHLGRPVPEMGNPDIRELVVRSLRLIYRVCPESIVILAVVPCAGHLASVWRRVGGG